jgi:hypothetical protein
MIMSRAPLCIAMVAVVVAPVAAKDWYVGGSGADFSEIQPAIDAASDGDVILVRPGTYQAFTLEKGVIVRASSTPFSVALSYPAHVLVQNIGASKRAGIAGMKIDYDVWEYHDTYVLVDVQASQGEVVLEDLSVVCDTFFYSMLTDPLRVADCSNVSITDLVASRNDSESSKGAVRIERSSVRISEVTVNVGKQLHCDDAYGSRGAPAIEIVDSFVVISGPNVVGGKGSDSCSLYHGCWHGGPGGHGITAANSPVLILGYDDRYSHSVRGGEGGDANMWNDCYGGDGGNGFSGSSAVVSNVTLLGGAGGEGPLSDGKPGQPWDGTLTKADIVPYLAMSGSFRPGGAFQLDLDVVAAGSLVFVFSDRQGFVTIPMNPGPPLGAIPGGRFVTFYAGHLDALGHMSVPLLLPNDPALRGTPVNTQCAVLLDAGGFVLSNATTHVVAE